MTETEEKGETGREGRHQSAVFFADDGMVASSDGAWLQGTFSSLVAIFDRVGLWTNVGKTVNMVCHPCWAGGRQPDGGGLQEEADGGREDIYRTAERESGVQEVWDGNRGWVHVESLHDSTWEGRNTAASLGPPNEWGTQDV